MLVVISDREQAEHARLLSRVSERTPDYSTGFATPSTKGYAMIVEFPVGLTLLYAA